MYIGTSTDRILYYSVPEHMFSEQWEGVTRSFAVSCTYTTMNKEAVSRDLILYTTMNHMRSFTVYNHEKEAVSRDLLLYTTMIKEAVSRDILLYTTINKEAVSRDLLPYKTMNHVHS